MILNHMERKQSGFETYQLLWYASCVDDNFISYCCTNRFWTAVLENFNICIYLANVTACAISSNWLIYLYYSVYQYPCLRFCLSLYYPREKKFMIECISPESNLSVVRHGIYRATLQSHITECYTVVLHLLCFFIFKTDCWILREKLKPFLATQMTA